MLIFRSRVLSGTLQFFRVPVGLLDEQHSPVDALAASMKSFHSSRSSHWLDQVGKVIKQESSPQNWPCCDFLADEEKKHIFAHITLLSSWSRNPSLLCLCDERSQQAARKPKVGGHHFFQRTEHWGWVGCIRKHERVVRLFLQHTVQKGLGRETSSHHQPKIMSNVGVDTTHGGHCVLNLWPEPSRVAPRRSLSSHHSPEMLTTFKEVLLPSLQSSQPHLVHKGDHNKPIKTV